MDQILKKLDEKYSELMGQGILFIETEKNVDKIFVYGNLENNGVSFNALFEKNAIIYTTKGIYEELHLNNYEENVEYYLDEGIEKVEEISEIFIENNQEKPMEIKLIYDVHTQKLNAKFFYEKTDEGMPTLLMNWKDELQNEIDSREKC